MKILHWPVSWWGQTLNEIRGKTHLQLLELLERANLWKAFLNLSQSLVCLLANHINQLQVSCKQPLRSISNQEKVNQLISTFHQILFTQRAIRRSYLDLSENKPYWMICCKIQNVVTMQLLKRKDSWKLMEYFMSKGPISRWRRIFKNDIFALTALRPS